MKKFEIGKIYCSVGYNGKPDLKERILIKKVSEKMISFVHLTEDNREYTLNYSGRKVDTAKIKKWDCETERVHLNIGILGKSYLAKNEYDELTKFKEFYLVVNTINGKTRTFTDYEEARFYADNQPNQEKMVSFMITLKVDENNVPQKMSGCLY